MLSSDNRSAIGTNADLTSLAGRTTSLLNAGMYTSLMYRFADAMSPIPTSASFSATLTTNSTGLTLFLLV